VKSFLNIVRDVEKLKMHDPEAFLDMSLMREVEKNRGAISFQSTRIILE